MRKTLMSGAALLLLVSGCASRGFVRNEVGSSADALGSRIETTETEISTARADIDEANTVNNNQNTRLEQVDADLDTASGDRTAIRRDLDDTAGLAEAAMETADSADRRGIRLAALFGDRNNLDVQAERQFGFDFDSAELDDTETMNLQEIGQLIESDPNMIIVLEGRTDSQGDDAYNLALAERRIEAVKRHLVLELGVPFFRIHTFSFGEAAPLAPNEDIETRRQNRTVRLIVLAPPSDPAAASED